MWTNTSPLKLTIPSLIFFLLFCSLSRSIYIPLSGQVSRCMIVYSVGESETVKVDINFPPLTNQQAGEVYQLSWTNTETN